MTDWIRKAAAEIISSADLDPNAINAVAVIIELYSPFERDVAYMPVPRCKTCRYFRTHIKLHCAILQVEVSADFGCIRWTEKI